MGQPGPCPSVPPPRALPATTQETSGRRGLRAASPGVGGPGAARAPASTLPVPSPGQPHARRARPPPALTASLCRPWSAAAAGRSTASAPRLENLRPAGGARACRLRVPCSASSALWPVAPPPPPPPPPGPRIAARRAARGAARHPGRGQGREQRGGARLVRVRACLGVRAPPSRPPGQSGGRRQGPQGIWGFTPVRVQMCVCVWYMWCAREGARRGGYTCACVHGRVCRCGYVCTPCARAGQECILADGAVCTSLCSCACVQARYPRARRGAFVCAGR